MIICVAGMPGSGKSIVAKAAKELGIPVYVMGDVVREEARRRGLELTPENLNKTASLLRREEGLDAVARRLVSLIKDLKIVLVDGVRSLHEVNVFREHGDVVIIGVHASPKTRFKRIIKRKRPGDARSWDEFVERDMVELGFGVGDVIALADYMLVNEGSPGRIKNRARRILEKLIKNGVDKS